MKAKVKSFIVGVFLTSIVMFSFNSYAAGIAQAIDVVLNGVNLEVNGQRVQADNILYNGTTYVPLRAISEMLGKHVGWNGDTNTASINDTQPVEKNTKTNALGGLTGSITYQFNKVIGTKPDVEAKIFLIKKDAEKINEKEIMSLGLGFAIKDKGFYVTKADGYGKYKFQNIPVGEYIIAIASDRTYRSVDDNVDELTRKKLEPYFSDLQKFITYAFGLGKYKVDKIEIIESQEAEYGFDFGNTYFLFD